MTSCERAWEIDAFRAGKLRGKVARSFERHLRTCAACREALKADERLQELALALPDEQPGELALRRVRARVLRDVAMGVRSSRRTPTRYVVAFAGLTLVAAVTVAFARTRRTPTPIATTSETYAGAVVASGDTRWSRERVDGIERVMLERGSLHVHVRPQSAHERFLVVLPDGTLEVRGTTFDVRVEEGITRGVRVDEGVVDLRIDGREPVRLSAGDSWPVVPAVIPPPTAAPITMPAPVTIPTSTGSVVPSSVRPEVVSIAQYSEAMRLFRDGRNEEAAAAFHAFAQAQPHASQAEDASFLEAAALARAGRDDAAALAAERHLAAFPSSFHRRDASILVARAAVERKDCGRARSVVLSWLNEPDVATLLHACP